MRAVILLALVGAAFAVPKTSQRIVGGEATTIQQYPYLVNLQFRWFGIIWSSSCGGSLITSRDVLTAAHCVLGDSHLDWRAVVGSTFANSGITHALNRIISHPEYTHASINKDVAVLRLLSPIDISSSTGTAPIAGPNYNLPDGSPVISIGWGTLWSDGPVSNTLQHVTIDVINHQLCADRYAYLKTLPGYAGWPDITEHMLCAGIQDVGGKDACQGDSGGPLVNYGVIVGVTSWGFGCGDAFYPGVNARVSTLSSWIADNANN